MSDEARTVVWCENSDDTPNCWPAIVTPGRAYHLCCQSPPELDTEPIMPDSTDYSDAGLLLAAINNEAVAGNCNTAGVFQLSDAYRDKGEEWQQAADFLHLVARWMETWPHPEFSSTGDELRPTCHPVVTFGKVWWRLRVEWPAEHIIPARWICAMRSREVDGKHRAELRWLTHDGKLSKESKAYDLADELDNRERELALFRAAGRNQPDGPACNEMEEAAVLDLFNDPTIDLSDVEEIEGMGTRPDTRSI